MKIIPSIGLPVHFVMPSGKHRPAIIVEVFDTKPTDDSLVNLQVFTDGTNDKLKNIEWRTSVHQAEANKKPGTWHAPEQV